jgi:hypothetical protein
MTNRLSSSSSAKMFVVANRQTPREIAMFFQRDLRRIVSTHSEMFRRLLDEEGMLPLELAALFEDVGNRYLDIAERIRELRRPRAKVG